ncbi:MAG: hypothetical protein K2L52_03545 [Clostridia bacterium]|nr:hypothetical protein [Clostridia bacterium]
MIWNKQTGKKYYSVQEKIKHYSSMLERKDISLDKKKLAKQRLIELKAIDNCLYDEPTMIITDDKYFGNPSSKLRACVVVGVDNKQQLLACPVRKRTIKTVILENDTDRQMDSTVKILKRKDVYETKNISGLASLTSGDKKKIKAIHGKK